VSLRRLMEGSEGLTGDGDGWVEVEGVMEMRERRRGEEEGEEGRTRRE
jgi:hypothetical protein